MSESLTPERQQEKAVQDAIALVNRKHVELASSSEGLTVATVRLLAARNMITRDDLRDSETDRAISLNRVLNHVPVEKVKRQERHDSRYIQWLESALTTLLNGIDSVSGLTGVKKTVKGQRLLELSARARRSYESVRGSWVAGAPADGE